MEAEHGEEVDRIIEQMEPDDAEHLTFVAEFAGRSFDDETDIPMDWTHITPDAMTIDDGHHSSWEYSRKEVRQGHMFHDKVHLQHCWYFLCSSREFYKHTQNTVVALHQDYSNVSLFIYSLGKAEARNDNK